MKTLEEKELQLLVEQLSIKHFGKPFLHKATFNPRLRTTGGRYLLATHNIEINKKYLDQLGKNELIGIIKHELCHYHLHIEGKGYKHGDKDFKELLKKVDAPRYCNKLTETAKTNRSKKIYYYTCVDCKQIYKRKRRMDISRYVCGKCRGKLSFLKEERVTHY